MNNPDDKANAELSPITRRWLPTIAVCAMLVVVGPLFVNMPLNSDTALYDLQANRVLQGGVLYRDIVEPNLPGVVWIHLAIRGALGWSSEAMRLADLLIISAVLLICRAMFCRAGQTQLFAVAALLFYLSCNEWCHCQRDVWMLLPAIGAVWLRVRRGTSARRRWLSALAEGVCWGCAFWIKPHVAIPALSVIVVDVLCHKDRVSGIKEMFVVILGGMLAAVPGIAWMISSGAWPHFWEMMTSWNPEYVRAGRERQSLHRWVLMFRRFYPWWLVHLVAVPVAWKTVRSAVSNCSLFAGSSDQSRNHIAEVSGHTQTVVSALYAGWLIQSLALQHAMDYIHVPAILLGILVLTLHPWQFPEGARRASVAAFLVLALLASPVLRPERVSMWTTCWQEGSSPVVRATLAHGNFPQWRDLSQVTDYLREQNVADGELTCLNVHSVHILRELHVQPATRYWCVQILQELFPSRADEIGETVRAKTTRFIVTESRESGLTAEASLPAAYPWNLPVVFRSGSYRVHLASTDIGTMTGQ